MELPDVRPEEPDLLLPGPDDLLALAEGDLQAEPIGHYPHTLAEVSVQKYALQPVGSSATTRIAPPAGRQVARNVLYLLTTFSRTVRTTSRAAGRLAWPGRSCFLH